MTKVKNKSKKKSTQQSHTSLDVGTLTRLLSGIVALIVALLSMIYLKNKSGTSPSSVIDFSNIPVPKGSNPEGKPRPADRDCVDRYDECVAFRDQGECVNTPGWMIINCPKSCKSCHLRDPTLRCDKKFLNISLEPAYVPGDMNSMFNTLIEKHGNKYGVEILSTEPWVVTFENFLTVEETEALIATNNKKWERSTDSGQTNVYGETGRVLSSGRTSSNSWCNKDCEEHPDVASITSKIETITGVSRLNFESFQVLRYEDGQHYKTHHDFGADDVKLACGPRILTLFLYLSDVEEGGETAFPSLGIKVKPKRGKALLWPSTLDSNLEVQDPRTMHEAKPVVQGLKYAANSWIHLYEYKTPNKWGCTGAFDEL